MQRNVGANVIRTRISVLVFALFFAEAGGGISAATYHVSQSGSDTPPYSSYATAAHRIIDATRLATEQGDTVLVHAGDYDVDSTLFIWRGVTWLGAGRDSTVVVWTNREYGSTVMAELFGRNEVAGFDFDYPFGNSNLDAYSLWPHPYPDADTVVIRECRFKWFQLVLGGNTRAFVSESEFFHHRTTGIRVSCQFAVIRDNRFSGGSTLLGGTGIKVSGGIVYIEQNVFDNSVSETGEVSLGRPDAAINVPGASQVIIRNNLIIQVERPFRWYYANGIIENNTFIDAVNGYAPPYDEAHFFQRSNQTLSIRNNLFLDNTAQLMFGLECTGCDSTGWITLSYNAYWPPVDSFYRVWPEDPPTLVKVIDSANFNAYPMLTDDSLYALQYGSPLIDAGDPSILDVDGSRSDVGWTAGPLGYSYIYEDLAPQAPESIAVVGNGSEIGVSWRRRRESDLSSYHVYRGTSTGFWNPSLNPIRVVSVADSSIVDTLLELGGSQFYVITATDNSGLESEPSPEGSYVVSGIFDNPEIPAGGQAVSFAVYPNPASGVVRFELSAPEAGIISDQLSLEVYDVLGRKVACQQLSALSTGSGTISWQPVLESGNQLASGVYFAIVRAGEAMMGKPVKFVLIK